MGAASVAKARAFTGRAEKGVAGGKGEFFVGVVFPAEAGTYTGGASGGAARAGTVI